jgi:adenine-specific DNA-methyltransferase
MKGYVPTPDTLVDKMVARLFLMAPPKPDDRLLDPGSGEGQFVDGVLRWCRKRGVVPPRITGVELDPARAKVARARFANDPNVEIVQGDYLGLSFRGAYRYVVGNPPYVSLARLSERERASYRARFDAARGRFDLYMLFFERALEDLAEGGCLVFVTPEKFAYVAAASPLRRKLSEYDIKSVEFIAEASFPDRTTYPLITALQKRALKRPTAVLLRDGSKRSVEFGEDGGSWLPAMMGSVVAASGTPTLGNVCRRISAGVATGADKVYVLDKGDVPRELRGFARPAIAGRNLATRRHALPEARQRILVPYDEKGVLLPEAALGPLGRYLREGGRKERLDARTCAKRKPWYAFHDNCPMPDLARPKILCKDICERPRFWLDRSGDLIPLHTVYYIVPHEAHRLGDLLDWLNGEAAERWLLNHCHRAANGFIRLQSAVLRNLPVPASLVAGTTRIAA